MNGEAHKSWTLEMNLNGSWHKGHSHHVQYSGLSGWSFQDLENAALRQLMGRGSRTPESCTDEYKACLEIFEWGSVECTAFSLDSDLEAFSRDPADGSFAALACLLTAFAKCLNERFLSY